MNARLSGALVDAAAVYGLDEDGLADLAAFARRHPDFPARVAQRVKERCRELGVANPARGMFVELPLERMESLASRVLTGTFDEEFLAYCDARMTHYDDLGYEPRYLFPWATIVPVEVGRPPPPDSIRPRSRPWWQRPRAPAR